MRLMGWTNVTTGEVRSPYPLEDLSACRKYAFSGIHNVSPAIFQAFEESGFSGRFPIMDFYIQQCARYPIYGALAPSLQLVDVGKLDSLEQAEEMVRLL